MSSDLQLFNNSDLGSVCVVMRDNEPWFVAKDVAACIEYKDVSTMCRLCRDKDKIVVRPSDLTSAELADVNNREYTLISESGLYRILAKCNLPKCESFESWVFDDVLPSIRRNGVYATDNFIEKTLEDPDWAISMLLQVKHEREQRKLAEAQRDEAIRTKYHFVEGRDAKLSGENGGLRKQNEKLREQLGDAKRWKQVKWIPWLKEYFVICPAMYSAVGKALSRICREMNWETRTTPGSDFDVKVYPIKAIELLKSRLDADPKMLGKYRKQEAA